MHYPSVGLMWYESKEKQWRLVSGLKLNGYFGDVAMAEYNGKLAFLWKEDNGSEVWCGMIALHGSKVAIRGTVEWSDCLLSKVPDDYIIRHFIVCSD
ncbi:unnamed protein product [Arabis nemorensis]|uniref:F-box associated domain-containing protein n=1 Tax=Arabis nemorensis TaxID=586526 RepID=A0A565BS17_9BRAS|nr:unnamed protein product [Arabis nemorensis]